MNGNYCLGFREHAGHQFGDGVSSVRPMSPKIQEEKSY